MRLLASPAPGIALVAFILAGCGSGAKPSAQLHPTTASQAATTATTGSPVPRGFEPSSFTAVSQSNYWLLGSVPCRTGRCTAIVHTADGGHRFTGVPAPRLEAATRIGGTNPTLRFADRLDGYAYVTGVGGVFDATHDGGATWQPLALGSVVAFATGGGYAYAVTAHCSTQRCTGYRFERSRITRDDWHAAAMPFTPGSPVLDLTARGPDVWLLGTSTVQSPSQNDDLALSTDRGRTFITRPGPCVPGLGGGLEPTSGAVVWAVCPTGMMAGAWRSSDGGTSFTRLPTPPLVNSATLAPASQDTAVLARNGAGSHLLRTTDAGRTWRAAITPGTATYVPWIGFTNGRVGAALVFTYGETERETLWRTTDGGAKWSAVAIR